MSGGFDVSTDQLRSHAGTVEGVAGSVDEAAAAAGTERAGGLVYGVLFDVFALTPLNWWADSIERLIRREAELGHAIAAGIATNADTYDGIEQANEHHISKSGK
ncbi:MAG: hypothetical protein ACR2LX_06955 [Jatrophihabitans sp.]